MGQQTHTPSTIFDQKERVDEFIDKSKVTSNKLQVVDNCIHQRNYLRSHLVQGLTPQLNGIASVEQNGDYMYIQ